VDDLIVIGKQDDIEWLKSELSKNLSITDKGLIQHCLSMQIEYDHRTGRGQIHPTIFCDADFGNNLKSSKCISRCHNILGHCLIDWQCTQQSTVALSTCEAEISALVDGVTQLLYLRDLLSDLNLHYNPSRFIYRRTARALLAMINSGGKFRRTKHF